MALALLGARAHARVAHGFLWAEDATIFMKQAYEDGLSSFLIPYAGYGHVIPRSVALLQAVTSSVYAAPYFYAYAALLIPAASCALGYSSLRRTICSDKPVIALVMSLLPVMVPHEGEVYLTVTNLQWVIAPTVLALCIECFFSQPRTWVAPVVFALGLTGPFAVIFTPVAVVGFLRKRTLNAGRLAWASSVLIQASVMFATRTPGKALAELHWRELFCVDFLLGAFLPEVAKDPSTVWYLYAPFVLGVAILVSAAAPRERAFSLACLALAVTLWALGVARINAPEVRIQHMAAGARYLIIPTVLVGWAILLGMSSRPRWVRASSGVLMGMLFLSTLRTPFVQPHARWEISPVGPSAYQIKAAPAEWSLTYIELPAP